MAKKKTTSPKKQTQQIFGELSKDAQDVILERIKSEGNDFDSLIDRSDWADFISAAFTWSRTPEGSDFWIDIRNSTDSEYIQNQLIQTFTPSAIPTPKVEVDRITGSQFMDEFPRVIAILLKNP